MNHELHICHCGHDQTSHYLDHDCSPPTRGACLCRGCDCRRYTDRNDPKVAAQVTRPQHPYFCRCYFCKQFTEPSLPEAPDTSPMGFGI